MFLYDTYDYEENIENYDNMIVGDYAVKGSFPIGHWIFTDIYDGYHSCFIFINDMLIYFWNDADRIIDLKTGRAIHKLSCKKEFEHEVLKHISLKDYKEYQHGWNPDSQEEYLAFREKLTVINEPSFSLYQGDKITLNLREVLSSVEGFNWLVQDIVDKASKLV